MPDLPPIVLVFAASDPSGGAGLQADIMTLSSMGCHPLSVVTAVTIQDTTGVDDVSPIDARIERSTVLNADDLTWTETRRSSSREGRRYHVGLNVVHRPTGEAVTVNSEHTGGRTRREAREARIALYLDALVQLERLVREAERQASRRGPLHRQHM